MGPAGSSPAAAMPPPQRAIPSVDKVLQHLAPTPLPRPWVVESVRQLLQRIRASAEIPSFAELIDTLNRELATRSRQRLQPVINATGILAHTNLGRAPLGTLAVQRLTEIASGYSNLECDLETGERGSRARYLEAAIALATRAPAATVVNNCAAALVLILRHFTAGPRKEVVISRGELVQIGGGFRIPEILESSGARLREVGTTNQTSIEDYARALGPETALILRVHRSNFYMEGFVDSPPLAALADLAQRTASPSPIPVVEDLGSGAWIDLTQVTEVNREPQPSESLDAGADLVCFSGDKLLGGPQAGIIVGRATLIAALKADPFFRALRCDKLTFAALEATVESYLHAQSRRDADPPSEIPMIELLGESLQTLRSRAEKIVHELGPLARTVSIEESQAQIGGGVCPRSHIPSVALAIRPTHKSVETLARDLRCQVPPIISFIADQAVRLDLRTVFPSQDPVLVRALTQTLAAPAAVGP